MFLSNVLLIMRGSIESIHPFTTDRTITWPRFCQWRSDS